MVNFSPLYPYNGRALNLIDKFYIFGYNYLTLKKYLIDETPKISFINFDEKNKLIPSFIIDQEPSILSEMAYDYNKEIIDSELIKKLIFPNGLKIPYILKEKKGFNPNLEKDVFKKIELFQNKSICPRGFKSVFSNTPNDGENNNKRKSQNAFAYTFYRPLLKEKEIDKDKILTFYIPYTFCIISEFPFYIGFQKLFKFIRRLFAQKLNYIPIEVLLYQIISLTPSPLNTDVILDLNLMCNQQEIILNNKKKQDIIFKRSISYINVSNHEKNFNDEIQINKSTINKKLSLKTNKKNGEEQLEENVIIFKYLSGYPLIEYNLVKVLFKELNIDNIIKIFLFTFLEQEIIFFSYDVEYLSLTINSYANFNYPLNDAEYFYMIGAISLQEFQEGNTVFGLKNYSSIIAINNKYVNNYLTKENRIGNHIVVDLDAGEIYIATIDEKDDNIKKINELIKNIIDDNHSCKHMKETYLYIAIKTLKKRLNEIYTNYYENKNFKSMDYIEINNKTFLKEYENANKSIQEAFYECVIILSFYFYENILILEENNNNSMKVEFNYKFQEENQFKTEEILIIKELLGSMKLRGSFMQFVMEHNPIDLLKIPLTFTDEFISFFSKKKFGQNLNNIKYFELIDKLYLSRKSKKIPIIDFQNEMIKYFKNFKKKFDREIKDNEKKRFKYDYSAFIKTNIYNKENIIEYQTYELDDRILLKYIYIIKSLTEKQYSELISENLYKEKNIINQISIIEIESSLEEFFIENGYLSEYDLFCGNVIILFALSLKYFPENFDCNFYLKILLENFIVFRKYISILLQLLYKLYIQSLQEKNYNMSNRMKLCFYSCFNYIRMEKLFPNENLMYLINKFFKSISEEENNNNIKKTEIKEENDIINEELSFKFIPENLILFNNSSDVNIDKKGKNKNKERKKSSNNNGLRDSSSKIRYTIDKNNIFESKYLSQKDIFKNLTYEYNIYIDLLNFNVIKEENVINSCLNIFLFIKENEENKLFKELEEPIKIMENIFYIFIKNKLIKI